MDEQTETPRRSARIVHKASALKPVTSYKTNHPYTWPKSPLPAQAVRIDNQDAFLGKDASSGVRFYGEIYRNTTPAQSKTFKASKTRHEVFSVGDTVLVNNRTSKFPSVGVIVAMWQPNEDSDDEESGEDPDGEDAERGCICVHWFVQPGELAQVRAARDHAPVKSSHSPQFSPYTKDSPTERNILRVIIPQDNPSMGHSRKMLSHDQTILQSRRLQLLLSLCCQIVIWHILRIRLDSTP